MSKHSDHPLYSVAVRILVWATLLGTVFLLRSFFLLIFLTFVFAYIQSNGVRRIRPWISSRTLRVVVVGLVFLSAIVLILAFLVPRVQHQAEVFASKFGTYLNALDREIIELRGRYPLLQQAMPLPDKMTSGDAKISGAETWNPATSPSALVAERLFGSSDKGSEDAMKEVVGAIRQFGAVLFGVISAFLLSLLFSFLIVLDLPKLERSVHSLKNSKLRFAYDEVGPTIANFGTVMGRALEAQFLIAVLNTILTAIGLYFLGLTDAVAFLSMIVFFCSFIPVAGVFISSMPICLMALQTSGVGTMLLSVLLITVIHMIEAYILNPRIYGAHLRINPVIVLIILTVGGKLFGVWGLVLGVPLCSYIFGHAIRYHSKRKTADVVAV